MLPACSRAAAFGIALATTMDANAAPAFRLVAPLAPSAIPAQPNPSIPGYGYEPYDSANPRGFLHPNDMGYGRYHSSTRLHGHRATALSHRYFRGY